MSDAEHPEPDRLDGAPHPRETERVIGHDDAAQEFLTAFNSGRLHHGWLISGPRGIGKASLAYSIARFLLATPENQDGGLFGEAPAPSSLEIPADHPVATRIRARSEPGLAVVTRTPNPKTGRMRDVIVVDDIRSLSRFLSMSAPDGGRRVVLIDAADEMNTSAANALLKMLEEPPAATYMLLLSHQPSRLLPTIRSRCRELRLSPLSPADMDTALVQAGAEADPSLMALSQGSVGEAMRLHLNGGLQIYAELVGIFQNLPETDRQRALKLADAAAQRGAAEKFDLLLDLFDLFLARLARTGATGTPQMPEATSGEAKVLARLCPSPHAARAWAQAAQEISTRSRHGQAVNLDASALVLDMVFKIQEIARQAR